MRARTLALGLGLFAACGDDASPDGAEITLTAEAGYAESRGEISITAKRNGDASSALLLAIRTENISAVDGSDFALVSNVVEWPAGDGADRTIKIKITDDLEIEGEETFQITMLADVPVSEPLQVLIQDDDRVGEVIALASDQRLVSFDRDSSTVLRHAAVVKGVGAGEVLLDIDVRPRDGKLYAVSDTRKIYSIDAAKGMATMVSTLAADPGDVSDPFTALVGTKYGMDFNPVVDRLRLVSDTGQNLRIDVDTGRTTTDGTIRGVATGLAAAGYVNSVAEACRTRLYGINLVTSQLVVQDPPNDGTTTGVGAGLGVLATSALLDMATTQAGVTSTVAVLTVAGGESALYSIDLATGAATRLGALGLASGVSLRGLALRPPALTGPVVQAAGELYAVAEDNRLLSFNRAAPAKPCTKAMVAGLATSEAIVGLDVRPSTGVMHALAANGTVGAIYTIDPVTGAASGRVALSAPLAGTAFGVDFNPTGPVAMRIVSDTGMNLRVTDLALGTTVTDGALNGASTGASGAAYINSAPGAAATTLYTIDPTVDRLRIQNPPNAGTQVDVGALGVDATAIDGFDIDGRDNVAFVALAIAGGTATTFHTMDLTTGAVSASLGSFGTRLRGMARPTPVAVPATISAAE